MATQKNLISRHEIAPEKNQKLEILIRTRYVGQRWKEIMIKYNIKYVGDKGLGLFSPSKSFIKIWKARSIKTKEKDKIYAFEK